MARKPKKRCSLCGKELQFAYNLQKYGVEGHVCGACYTRKLKEVYGVDRELYV